MSLYFKTNDYGNPKPKPLNLQYMSQPYSDSAQRAFPFMASTGPVTYNSAYAPASVWAVKHQQSTVRASQQEVRGGYPHMSYQPFGAEVPKTMQYGSLWV